jgi:hypothetical protein
VLWWRRLRRRILLNPPAAQLQALARTPQFDSVTETFARWFFLLWGTVVSVIQTRALWRGWQARRWPATTGQVLDVGLRYHRARRGGYLPEVRYRYAVGGQELVGSRLRFGGRTLLSERAAKAALRGAQPGAEVAVHYNPQDPREAVLQPGVSIGDVVWLAAGLIALGIGFSGMGFGASAG